MITQHINKFVKLDGQMEELGKYYRTPAPICYGSSGTVKRNPAKIKNKNPRPWTDFWFKK